ncbi:VWA domain-containing protein [Ferrimonas balearica]|uniref:VWA domain-containing protein n=1 Tax=Ferrimonas balearica TaxID=44012 RepID=UPI001C99266C|nr:VWA domain-containing protein [Ferrimonas balearica]MBY5992243.1 VWA domain-containing protein [Ferrimonas balearica]
MLQLESGLSDYAELLSHSPALQRKLAETLATLEAQAQQTLVDTTPFAPWEQRLAALEATPVEQLNLADASRAYQGFRQACRLPDNRLFWQAQLSRSHSARQHLALGRLLLTQWRRALDGEHQHWRLAQLQRIRQDCLAQLRPWLDQLLALSRRFAPLGLEPGVLVDFSESRGGRQAAQELERWASYLEANPGIAELCEQIGRQRRPTVQTQYHPVTVTERVPAQCANAPAPEALFGIQTGRDLTLALPAELAQLGDPELETLFDLKYLEHRLTQYQRRGWHREWQWQSVTRLQASTVTRAPGPLILCIDTSLSMQGAPELAAKAIALCLASQALAQGRECHLINFATDLAQLDLGHSPGALIEFLCQSFHGGTDVAPALTAGLDQLADPRYALGDLVLISDFVLADLPKTLLAQLGAQRHRGHQCFGVMIGEQACDTSLDSQMDRYWHYDARRGDIEAQSGRSVPLPQAETPAWLTALEGSA